MKTLVVFLTLWSTCFSKPSALQEQSHPVEVVETQTEFFGRTHLQDQESVTHDEDPGTHPLDRNDSPLQERSIPSQQPLLIKKGYHIYRSADEQQILTDTKQNCNKQVKVNICEEDSEANSNQMRFDSALLRSRDNMNKNEMKKTIKMVKEVVEHMQKDLQTLEDTSTDLLKEDELQEGQTKTQLHDDFVILHTVLDDLVKHIGDSSKTSNSDSDKKGNKKTSHEDTEESRMMQWKDTMKITQEDSGKNIEDRFAKDNEATGINQLQSNPHNTSMENEDKIPAHVHSLETLRRNNEDAEMSITQDINKKGILQSDSLRLAEAPIFQIYGEEMSSKSTGTDQKTLQHNNDENTHEKTKSTEDDTTLGMNTVAVLQDHMQDKSTITHMVKRKSDEIDHTLNHHNLDEHIGSSNQMIHKSDQEFKTQDDGQASDSSMKIDHVNGQTHHTDFAKHSGNEMVTETLQQVKSSSNSDTSFDSHSSAAMPPREATHGVQNEVNNKFHSNIKTGTHEVPHQLSESLNTRLAMDRTNQALRTMTSNEVQAQHDSSQSLFNHHSHRASTGKVNNEAGIMDESLQQHLNSQDNSRWTQERGMDTSMSDTIKMNTKMQEGKSGTHSQDSMTKSQHSTGHQHHHSIHQGDHMHRLHESSHHHQTGRMPFDEHFTPSVDNTHLNSQLRNDEIHSAHHSSQLSNGRFAHDHYMMPAMRANMGFSDSSSMGMQSQHQLNMPHGHHFSTGMSHGQAMFHNEQMSESDSMVQASEHIAMRDAMLRSGGEYPQYYNSQGNNKGPGYQEQPSMQPVSGNTGGAVGLFPNSNSGGRGIPLLITCSPNVVTGTIAKGQPPYTPSYRSMDAYRYHKKREAKNPNSKLEIKTVPKIICKSTVQTANVIN